jgi:putative lipoic acid-binding regulatory protein
MEYSEVENKLTISLQNSKDIESPSYINMQIPKALISNVTSVVNTYADKAMEFTENKSTNPNYNSITIQLPHTDQISIDIIGSTIATAGEQVLRG